MSDIKFRIAAKTDVGCARSNNEDNFQAAADLSQPTMTWVNNQTYDLGEKGALLVVADGMGGMNAGEVASAIAIETVREFFTPERITPEVLKSRFTIEKFMKDVVVEADRRIKSRSTSETRGMGTTIVMAWLLQGQCYVCWCGDSRAYLYNPLNGLVQLSKDHSYVQALVDLGKITTEEAFDYPDNNVITRCLCDAHQKAEPDCLLQPRQLCDGDLILLCSDGLNGMLRDNEISKLIKEGPDDVNQLTDALIDGALAAGGNDNVTVAVARIDSGGAQAADTRITVKDVPKTPEASPIQKNETADTDPKTQKAPAKGKKMPAWVWAICGFVAAVIFCVGAYFYFKPTEDQAAENPAERRLEIFEDETEMTEELAEPETEELVSELEPGPAAPKTGNNAGRATAPETPAAIEEEQPAQINTEGVINRVSQEPEKEKTAPAKTQPTPEEPSGTPSEPSKDPDLDPV